MFETVSMAPPDAIVGLTETFDADPNPAKINLSVGVYKDADGNTPVLASVQEAEQRILRSQRTKNYKPIQGDPAYAACVQQLLWGDESRIVVDQCVATAHTPGGTGALRVAGDYLKKNHPGTTVWLSDPTWPNHPQVFAAAGLSTKIYPYFDHQTNALAFETMLTALHQIPAGDVVLFHGCCHNPTGVDPSPQQWAQIGEVLATQKVVPLIDLAYQGFTVNIHEDAGAVVELSRWGELLVCSSWSKNFGLYNERVGALSIVTSTAEVAKAMLSQIKTCIRANYSNPPAHGAQIVTTVLNDPKLRQMWEGEVKNMRDRISRMRRLFVDRLDARGLKLASDNTFIVKQHGMFSFSGLNKQQVHTLRQNHSIYIVDSGRINMAGMTEQNIDTLCDAIATVC